MKKLIIILAMAFTSISQNALAQNTTNSSIISVTVSLDENSHNLTWMTQKEINSSYFIVERSTNELNYTAIGTVKAAGYSLINKNYALEDFDTNSIAYYYRVILVNMEGERTCSQTVRAKQELENSMLAEK